MNLQEIKNFLKSNKESVVLSHKIPCDLLTPVQALLKIQNSFKDNYFLYESVEKGSNKSRHSVIGLMPDLIFKSCKNESFINREAELNPNNFLKILDKNPINSLRELIKESQIKNNNDFLSSGIFGYMSYDMVRLMEDLPDGNLVDEINIPDSIFIRPQILIIFDSLFDIATIHAPIYYKDGINTDLAYEKAKGNIERIVNIISQNDVLVKSEISLEEIKNQKKYHFSSNVSETQYCKMVEKSKEYIKDGDVFQVLPSFRMSASFDEKNSFALYRSLRSINPSPFLFYLKFEDFSFMGSSPEIMVSCKNKKVTIRPLAGSRKRGKDELEDKIISEELLSDEKELAEHLMLTDLGRHDVGRVCKANTVKLTQKMIIEYYSHIMHIGSNVQGILKDDLDALDALISGFPAGTVSGAPKIRAMQIIEEIENVKRSFYAGCVGYFSGSGDMETCISLRSALVKNNKIYLQSGAGVVHDSIPQKEYEECKNKLAALIAAVENVDLYQ